MTDQLTINEPIARPLHCTCCHNTFVMTDDGPNWEYEDGPDGFGMCSWCNADICRCGDTEDWMIELEGAPYDCPVTNCYDRFATH